MAKILIAEDDIAVQKSINAVIQGIGHEVTCTNDGGQALAALKDATFDLMMTDIRMEPTDGMQLIEGAHKLRPEMPIIVVSAMTSEQMVADATAAGATAYVKKPFRVAEVIALISKVLGDES